MQQNTNPYAESITVTTSYDDVPGTANAYPLHTAPQFVDASPLPMTYDALVATIQEIVRAELQSMQGEIRAAVMKEFSQQLRMQGAATEDKS